MYPSSHSLEIKCLSFTWKFWEEPGRLAWIHWDIPKMNKNRLVFADNQDSKCLRKWPKHLWFDWLPIMRIKTNRNLGIICSLPSDFTSENLRPREVKRCIVRPEFHLMPWHFCPWLGSKSLAMNSSGLASYASYPAGKVSHLASSSTSHTS